MLFSPPFSVSLTKN